MESFKEAVEESAGGIGNARCVHEWPSCAMPPVFAVTLTDQTARKARFSCLAHLGQTVAAMQSEYGGWGGTYTIAAAPAAAAPVTMRFTLSCGHAVSAVMVEGLPRVGMTAWCPEEGRSWPIAQMEPEKE